MGLGRTDRFWPPCWCGVGGENIAERAPALLVVPRGSLGNWKSESNRFTPTLRLAILHTSEMEPDSMDAISDDPAGQLRGTDLVMTTYGMVTRLGWLADFGMGTRGSSTRHRQ